MRVRSCSRITAALFAMGTLLNAADVRAQGKGFYWSLDYAPSYPVGSVRNFVPNVTPLSFDLGARWWFKQGFSLGVRGTYTRLYDQRDSATYQVENGAITAAIFRTIDVVGILPEAHYYLWLGRSATLFLGAGAGYTSVKFHTLVSDFDVGDRSSGLLVSSEAGVLIPYDVATSPWDERIMLQGITVGIRGTFTTAGTRDVSDTSYVGLTIGALVY